MVQICKMDLRHSFQVNPATSDVSMLLKNAFLPSFPMLPNITLGMLEMDFMIRDDGSLSLSRIISTNADLYSYFRRKLFTLQLNEGVIEHNLVYKLRFSVYPAG
jgi:hypothetical protein